MSLDSGHDLATVSPSQPSELLTISDHINHFLDHPPVRQAIADNFPDFDLNSLEHAAYPGLSPQPDALEIWEANQRRQRIQAVYDQTEVSPLKTLQRELYEGSFGVNATPGVNKSFKDSVAPTPGGMISHGYTLSTINGLNMETAAGLGFSGETAKEAVESLPDYFQKSNFARLLAEIVAPTVFGSGDLAFGRSMTREKVQHDLLRPGRTPEEEVDTWAYRLLKLVRDCPELKRPVEDPALKELIGLKPDRNLSLMEYWVLAWGKLNEIFLTRLENDALVYRDPSEPEVKTAVGTLLAIRVHPETQIMYKYLSPSGYLNEKKNS